MVLVDTHCGGSLKCEETKSCGFEEGGKHDDDIGVED